MYNIEHFTGRQMLHYVAVKTSELTLTQMLAIPCSTCGATMGDVCQRYTGALRSEPHRDRKLAAVEAVQRTIGARRKQADSLNSFARAR
jgi:hypothetical protein